MYLKVVAICTDDYQLNVRLFKSLAGSSNVQITCPNPTDSTRSIFLVFNPVYIVKCIRNNWINQKDMKTTLTFPSIDDFIRVDKKTFGTFSYQLSNASFKDLGDIYKFEQYSSAKMAHKLTSSVVWPYILERQSVPLGSCSLGSVNTTLYCCKMRRRIFPTKHINSLFSLQDFGRCVTYIILAKISAYVILIQEFLNYMMKGFIFLQGLFLGFRIGKCLVVLVELENLVRTPLPA